MQTYKRLMYFKHFFSTVNWLVPFTILAPSYFANELTLGELFQLIHVVGQVEKCARAGEHGESVWCLRRRCNTAAK